MRQVRLHDGGRFAAGYKGLADDCVCRALAIALQRKYEDVYREIALVAKENGHKGYSARKGMPKELTAVVMNHFGFTWVPLIIPRRQARPKLASAELPSGRIICKVSRHVCAVVDQVIWDNHDPQREGDRLVYGYWVLAAA